MRVEYLEPDVKSAMELARCRVRSPFHLLDRAPLRQRTLQQPTPPAFPLPERSKQARIETITAEINVRKRAARRKKAERLAAAKKNKKKPAK